MKNTQIQYSVIIPIYNASATLTELVSRIHKVFLVLKKDYEIIMIDDNSRDNSWEIIKKLKNDYENIRIIRLRRNFGQHNALMCGFNFIQGKYVITLDDDLQNPPEEIPKLIDKYKEGFDIVYGVYQKKAHNPIKNLGSRMIGWYYCKVFGMHNRISAFRLISGEVVKKIIHYDKSFTYIDGLISWNTGSVGEIIVKHSARTSGKSGYNIANILKLSFNMLTNFSAFPIRVVSLLGLSFSLLGFGMGIYFMIKTFVINIPVTGYTSTIVAITIFSGVQLLTVGIIGEYIARIHMNINKKPQYVIKERDL